MIRQRLKIELLFLFPLLCLVCCGLPVYEALEEPIADYLTSTPQLVSFQVPSDSSVRSIVVMYKIVDESVIEPSSIESDYFDPDSNLYTNSEIPLGDTVPKQRGFFTPLTDSGTYESHNSVLISGDPRFFEFDLVDLGLSPGDTVSIFWENVTLPPELQVNGVALTGVGITRYLELKNATLVVDSYYEAPFIGDYRYELNPSAGDYNPIDSDLEKLKAYRTSNSLSGAPLNVKILFCAYSKGLSFPTFSVLTSRPVLLGCLETIPFQLRTELRD